MKIKLIGCLILVLGIIFILRIPMGESMGFSNPDGKYTVYAKPYLWTYLFPMVPGDGNSKPEKFTL